MAFWATHSLCEMQPLPSIASVLPVFAGMSGPMEGSVCSVGHALFYERGRALLKGREAASVN